MWHCLSNEKLKSWAQLVCRPSLLIVITTKAQTRLSPKSFDTIRENASNFSTNPWAINWAFVAQHIAHNDQHTHIYIHRLTQCIVYAHTKIGANCWNFNKNNSGILDVGQRSCANGLRVRFKLAASGMKIARPRQQHRQKQKQKLYGCLTGSHIAYSYNDSRLNWDKRSLGSPSGPEFPTVAPASSSLMSFSWHSFGSGRSQAGTVAASRSCSSQWKWNIFWLLAILIKKQHEPRSYQRQLHWQLTPSGKLLSWISPNFKLLNAIRIQIQSQSLQA